jgi:hypothetical protein
MRGWSPQGARTCLPSTCMRFFLICG